MVSEHGTHRNLCTRARVGEHLRLLRLAERRQVAGEQDEVNTLLEVAEGLLELSARRLGGMHVAGCGDRHHRPSCSTRALQGKPACVTDRQEQEFERLLESMKRAAGILLEAEVPFILGGGLACWARGAPKTEHDVDFLVKPEDVERALAALAKAGLRTEQPPEGWLVKAY